MIKGPIRRIPRERLERRDDIRLAAAWVRTNIPPISAGTTGTGHLFHANQPPPVEVDRGSPVLVMITTDHAPVMAELLAPAVAGERVYVLAPTGWGQPKIDPQLLACRAVLIRRMSELPVSGVCRANESKLWLGATSDGPAPWCLLLDDEQAAVFRQLFLRLFWHHATDEGWTGGKQLSFRPAGERPFDIPEPSRSAPLRLLKANERPTFDTRGALMHSVEEPLPRVAPRRLWFPCSSNHHQGLARLVREGTEVVWEPRELPYLVIGEQKGIAWLPGTQARLLIELNSAQAADAARVLEDTPLWQFGIELRLGDYASQSGTLLWLEGTQEARPLEPEQLLNLPDVQSETVRATPETVPTSWTSAQPLALAARYKWTAVPPRIPTGSEEDPLLGRWRKVDEEWAKRCGKIREALQESDGHRGRIGRVFSRLLSALLGFERTQKTLLAELAALDQQKPSAAGPTDAVKLLQQISNLEERARHHQGDLDEAERRAREEAEKEKQESEWNSRVQAAKQGLPTQRTALAEKEAQLPDLLKLAEEIEVQLKDVDKREKNEKKDLLAKQQRASDDLTKLKADIKRLQAEVADLEERAAESFVVKPSAKPAMRQSQGAGRFVPEAPQSRAASGIPDEALPEVGNLRRHKGQRYLVIENWAELDGGEQAASRLTARLVAPENA